jgi:protein-S-isoprenylcysteine O-methyltransferase Ste14
MHWTVAACGYVWLIFVVIWVAAAFNAKPSARTESLGASLSYRIVAILAAILLFNSRLSVGVLGAHFRPHSAILDLAGFAITFLGIALAVWARFFLGRNWSAFVVVKQNHELIQRGPYALVRHPIYSGISLAALGTALTIGEIRGLIAVVLFVIAWRMKWGAEEEYMTQEFGTEYDEYKRRTHALIPGVW